MPIAGLSLLGFMSEQVAMGYLRQRCVLADAGDDAVRSAWEGARRRLGAPIANAGHPSVLEIPAEHHPHFEGVTANPRFQATVESMPFSFKLVEVDPLLAFQFHVETDRAADLCRGMTNPPSLGEMLPTCLPHALETIPVQLALDQNGVLLKSRSTNVRLLVGGQIGEDQANRMHIAGIGYGVSSPLIQVVRFNGRCYIKNGYHRAYGLRLAGASHVPCVFLEATEFGQVGAPGGGATFERDLLESANPPTLEHFTQGRAYPLTLRRMTRVIHVTWSEYAFPDDD